LKKQEHRSPLNLANHSITRILSKLVDSIITAFPRHFTNASQEMLLCDVVFYLFICIYFLVIAFVVFGLFICISKRLK